MENRDTLAVISIRNNLNLLYFADKDVGCTEQPVVKVQMP
jgi:hypothetical protein